MQTRIGDVSLSQAVELLGESGDRVTISGLSKYLTKHADAFPPKRSGKERVINFELLREHRRTNLGAAVDLPSARATTTRADEAARNIAAQRQLRELDLAERTGVVTPVEEVKEAGHAAVASLRGAFALALNETADQIAALTGVEPRLIRPHLRAFEKRGLEAFIRGLADRGIVEPEVE